MFKLINHRALNRATALGIRYISSTSPSYKAKVGTPFKSKEEITEFLSSPTWNVKEFLKNDSYASKRAEKINKDTVMKLLQLSGLEVKNDDEIQDIIKLLKEQVKFIDHLHSVEVESTSSTEMSNPLNLKDILRLIDEQIPDASKGETPGSWDPLSLAQGSKNGHYIVREGLLKEK